MVNLCNKNICIVLACGFYYICEINLKTIIYHEKSRNDYLYRTGYISQPI